MNLEDELYKILQDHGWENFLEALKEILKMKADMTFSEADREYFRRFVQDLEKF
jgi:hypothetical protein